MTPQKYYKSRIQNKTLNADGATWLNDLNSQKWLKDAIFMVGDSQELIRDDYKASASYSEMLPYNLKLLLQKAPRTITLHVGTNITLFY